MPIPSDTSAEAEAVQLAILRAMSPSERAARAVRYSDEVVRTSKRAIRRMHPELSDEEVGVKFVELHYGRELADDLRRYLAARKHG